MKRPLLLVVAAVLSWEIAITGSAAQPAQRVEIPSDEQALQPWIRKTNAYTELLNASLPALTSWSRYTSWVDVKRGPTGKERIVYGLYEVSPDLAKRALEAVDKVQNAQPAAPALDEAARAYAKSFEALVPIVNEASRYYERKDYKDDNFAKGREMHDKLAGAFQPFLAQRETLEVELKLVKTVINQRQLQAIEKREGKSYAWHVRNVMNRAEPLGDIIAQERAKGVPKALDEAIADFASAVRDFDDHVASPGTKKGFGTFDSDPRRFLGEVREYRDALASNSANITFKQQSLVHSYNRLVQSANMAIRLPM